MTSAALRIILLAFCAQQAFGLYTVEIQLLMSQGIECSTCSFDSSGGTYTEWTVNPGSTGDLIANISMPYAGDSISYSEPLCCKYLFSQDELTILQNNTDVLTQINLSFNRWANYTTNNGSAFDYAYNIGLYNNTNGQILYATWQSSDVNSNPIGPDSTSVFTSSVNSPDYTNKVKSVYIVVGYQIASNVNVTVNFANISVGLVFDDTERLQARAISYGVGIGVGTPVAFLIIFLPVYFKKIKPHQLAKKNQQNMKNLESGQKSDGTAVDPKYGAISATPRANSSKSTAELLAAGNYSPLGPVEDVSAPGSKSKSGAESKNMSDRFNIPYKEIAFKREIGAGGFGKVFMGEWQSTEVAIKVSNNISSYQEFRKEAELMVNIRPHPNVLQVLGVCTDGVSPAIIMEYCPGGSLDLLMFDKSKPVTEEYQFRLILGIARGMLHLHKNNIVHRDLAARNILLSRDGEPKISDFGMSRIIESSFKEGTTRTNIGTIRWMAPESIRSKKYSTKSDVWSFGVVISEILNREEPHSEIEDVLEIAMAIRNENRTPNLPEDVPNIMKEITKLCWAANPDDRPEMDAICDKLIKFKDQNGL